MASVTVIPATIEKYTRLPTNTKAKRRVAAYARVSTENEEQATSYEAQIDYYTKLIAGRSDWIYVDVYSDDGISGTSMKHRDGFNQMIQDALDGKIDLILTKSISRFARNTVDTLTTVRKLKERGIEVYFEKENIYTLDSKGELLITIMSSIAQEESRSISENVTWGHRKRFADGKVNMPFSSFLGYRRGENGEPVIVPEEAKIVKKIYKMFIGGKSANYIAKHLTAEGVPTPRGKTVWQCSTVESILTNEKYKGDAILQKKFTVDFLTKTMKPNEGEVPQYYVTDSHPAIIAKAEWELVQAEMAKRKAKGKHRNSLSPFSAKIICGDCGAYYGSKVWHSTDKYRRVIWQCNGKYTGEEKCKTPHLYETDIVRLFLKAVSHLLTDRTALLDDCRMMLETLNDTAELDNGIKTVENELDELDTLIELLIAENASVAMSQEEYKIKYEGYIGRFNTAKDKLDALNAKKTARGHEADILRSFMAEIQTAPDLPIEFSETLWNALIDHITVYEDESLVFTFKNGTEIKEML